MSSAAPASSDASAMETDDISATLTALSKKIAHLENAVNSIEGLNPDYVKLQSNQLLLLLRKELAAKKERRKCLRLFLPAFVVLLLFASSGVLISILFNVSVLLLQRQQAVLAGASGMRFGLFVCCFSRGRPHDWCQTCLSSFTCVCCAVSSCFALRLRSVERAQTKPALEAKPQTVPLSERETGGKLNPVLLFFWRSADMRFRWAVAMLLNLLWEHRQLLWVLDPAPNSRVAPQRAELGDARRVIKLQAREDFVLKASKYMVRRCYADLFSILAQSRARWLDTSPAPDEVCRSL